VTVARRGSTYRVYVIELDPAASRGTCAGRTCLYVGETADTPEERFAEQLRGYRASRVVRRLGLRLQGYVVFGGH
jgi:hypothetical protein